MHRAARLLAGTLLCLTTAGCAGDPSVITVGPTHDYKRPGAAISGAGNGDTVLIEPGVYNDCAVVRGNHVTVAGTGPGVILEYRTCEGKGILVVKGDDVTIRNLTLRGAQVQSHNGAGIRDEGAGLTVDNVRFVDNEDGILTSQGHWKNIKVLNSQFIDNGQVCHMPCHAIYAGHIGTVDIEHSRFFDQHVGHDVKSRALRTVLIGNTIGDGPNGTGSYEVDIPIGGTLIMEGNTVEKGPKAQNWGTTVTLGEEKHNGIQPSPKILIRDNHFINDNQHPTNFVRNLTETPAQLVGNTFTGSGVPLVGPGSVQ